MATTKRGPASLLDDEYPSATAPQTEMRAHEAVCRRAHLFVLLLKGKSWKTRSLTRKMGFGRLLPPAVVEGLFLPVASSLFVLPTTNFFCQPTRKPFHSCNLNLQSFNSSSVNCCTASCGFQASISSTSTPSSRAQPISAFLSAFPYPRSSGAKQQDVRAFQ